MISSSGGMKSVTSVHVFASASHCWIAPWPGGPWSWQVTSKGGMKPPKPSSSSFSSEMLSASMPSRICSGVMSAVPWISCAVFAASTASIAASMPRL